MQKEHDKHEPYRKTSTTGTNAAVSEHNKKSATENKHEKHQLHSKWAWQALALQQASTSIAANKHKHRSKGMTGNEH